MMCKGPFGIVSSAQGAGRGRPSAGHRYSWRLLWSATESCGPLYAPGAGRLSMPASAIQR